MMLQYQITELPKHLQDYARQAQAVLRSRKSVLLVGPPGAGKTMIARCVKLPHTSAAYTEALHIYRMAGLTPATTLTMPFRAPHHTVSVSSMLGDGGHFRPGDMSLAHNGVLFLDEVNEFSRQVLDAVRCTYRDGVVEFPRALHLHSLPANFALIGAMNSCPCGPSINGCTCTTPQVLRYHERLKQILAFDATIEVQKG